MENRESSKRPHERLDAWRDSMDLVEAVYTLTASLPQSERFGLTAQIRRSAVSIPSNIAEGAARRSTPDYLRFLSIARGSLAELDTQMKIAERVGYLDSSRSLEERIDMVFAKLTALMNALSRREPQP
ncbi:four helix bundle protein [Luteimonas sp. SJ-92]|uniref:Four helix bundle protein n=1 Tax=Luteimonas salinisoli TaxID=2752307 RepID=A0A853J7F8_9GAMM|nr:four helix bundle protein [Luteimonas salinisoli]NZA25066.1 four helix bundle protein [Luteimonas salinisoli]